MIPATPSEIMPVVPTLASEILQTVKQLTAMGMPSEEVHLGRIELDALAAVIEPRYIIAVDNAMQSGVPFHWHGYKIVPCREAHAFKFKI